MQVDKGFVHSLLILEASNTFFNHVAFKNNFCSTDGCRKSEYFCSEVKTNQ